MYGSGLGSFSGIIHVAARRPFIAAVVLAGALTASMFKPVPPPPIPPTPSVPTFAVSK